MNTDSGRIDTDGGPGDIDPAVNDLTHAVIGAAFEVGKVLGVGFLEKVYENALARELLLRGHKVEQQRPIEVTYKGGAIGNYTPDLLVDEKVIVELKVAQELDDIHTAQCLNYLKATGLRICLLINFYQKKVQVKRLVM